MKLLRKICVCSVPVFWALILFMASVADAELMPGDSLGSLKVETAEGGSLDLGDYGKSYILCFFVPGAGEQTEQLKNVEELLKREEFKDFELLVITRGIDAGEKKRAADYIARQRIKAVLLFEPELQAVKKFGVRTFPSFFVVDEKGVMKTLGIDSVTRKIRKRTFEDFLEMVNAGKEIPIIDMMPEKNADAKILSLVGKKAPDLALPDLDDEVHRLSDMKGKNVVLVFWSIGCPHCKVELPMINDFYNEHTSSYNFEVIAVTQGCCPSGSQKTVDFVIDETINYPILLDPDGKVSGKYKFRYVPTAFFINRDGIIVDFSIGTPKYFKKFYHSVFTDPLRLGADDQDSETGKEEQ